MSGRERGGHESVRRSLLCVPNVSEGRDRAVVEAIAESIRGVEGVRLLDYSSDPDHNRSVFAYLGQPEPVLEATQAMASEALRRIDMTEHMGRHPRLGAVDVVPFVPGIGVVREEALAVCRRFGRWVGEQGIPVYYYQEAATRPERRELPDIRRGGYEALAKRLATAEGAPDEGPAEFHPRSGAVVTGVRGPLVALNVNLQTAELGVAKQIARSVRHIDGGIPYVRALGIPLRERGMVQVSMNLIRPEETSVARVVEQVRAEAELHGVEVAGTEFIGPVPVELLVQIAQHCFGAHALRPEQVVAQGLIEG